MRARWFVSLLALAAALAGYAALRPLDAQADPFPFAIGETVRFTLPDNGVLQCRIEEMRRTFVRCGRDPLVQRDYWINVSTVIGLEVKAER